MTLLWLGARVVLRLANGDFLGIVEGIAGDGDIIVVLDGDRGTLKLPSDMFEREDD